MNSTPSVVRNHRSPALGLDGAVSLCVTEAPSAAITSAPLLSDSVIPAPASTFSSEWPTAPAAIAALPTALVAIVLAVTAPAKILPLVTAPVPIAAASTAPAEILFEPISPLLHDVPLKISVW